MDWTQIIVTLITVLFAGGISSYLTFNLSSRKQNHDIKQSSREYTDRMYQTLQKNLTEEIERLNQRVKELEKENSELRKKL